MSQQPRGEFEGVAPETPRFGILGEFWDFLKHKKKWWMLPILAALLVFGLLILLAATGAAPFIYTVF
jgi:hypothetical protein